GAETQPARHAARADAATLQVHGEALDLARAAGRILEIGQPVAVVVDAVTADLHGGRRAVVERRVRAGTGGAEILRAGVLVVAVGGGGAGGAAGDRGVLADAGIAEVGGAGVPVVAVGDRCTGRAAGDRGVLANAARAGIGRAGVLVVAVGGGGAERAAGEGGAGALPAAVADVVEGAGVAVVARRVGRLEGVRRAVDARPRARLGRVTD